MVPDGIWLILISLEELFVLVPTAMGKQSSLRYSPSFVIYAHFASNSLCLLYLSDFFWFLNTKHIQKMGKLMNSRNFQTSMSPPLQLECLILVSLCPMSNMQHLHNLEQYMPWYYVLVASIMPINVYFGHFIFIMLSC